MGGKVKLEEEAPTSEQLAVLNRVAQRVLQEFRLEKEGLALDKSGPRRTAAEQPLLGFCHGSPGTGKSRVIKWITRLSTEALQLQHEDEFSSSQSLRADFDLKKYSSVLNIRFPLMCSVCVI